VFIVVEEIKAQPSCGDMIKILILMVVLNKIRRSIMYYVAVINGHTSKL